MFCMRYKHVFFQHRFLLESELLIEEYLLAGIHFAVLIHPKLRKATKREISSFLHKVHIYSTKVLFYSIEAFKES